MGCGCDRAPTDTARTNAAMCLTCPGFARVVRADWTTTAVCTIDGRPFLPAGLRGAPCPLGRHADADGLVTWAGVKWRGTPYPLRLLLRLWRVPIRRGPLPGCGCIHKLKSWVEGVKSRLIQPAPRFAD